MRKQFRMLWKSLDLLCTCELQHFLNPQAMRRAMLALAKMNDSTLRFAGLTVMVVGCLLLYVVR